MTRFVTGQIKYWILKIVWIFNIGRIVYTRSTVLVDSLAFIIAKVLTLSATWAHMTAMTLS